jgi:hypothetical protein
MQQILHKLFENGTLLRNYNAHTNKSLLTLKHDCLNYGELSIIKQTITDIQYQAATQGIPLTLTYTLPFYALLTISLNSTVLNHWILKSLPCGIPYAVLQFDNEYDRSLLTVLFSDTLVNVESIDDNTARLISALDGITHLHLEKGGFDMMPEDMWRRLIDGDY